MTNFIDLPSLIENAILLPWQYINIYQNCLKLSKYLKFIISLRSLGTS